MSTHRRNFIFNTKSNVLASIGDGHVITFTDQSIIKEGVKNYFEPSGAFWYDVVIDYEGNYLELLNVGESDQCYSFEKFNHLDEKFKKIFKKQKLKKLCVWHK